ncbi:MAG: hypothetical protein NUV74_17170 [Candidatus Brocadiaceae bacterium]|nr:hypothetical protein [Candidatus Brocadiaceae bacterium]
MSLSNDEIQKHMQHVFNVASKHTDVLLSINNGKCVKFGSCIHIKVNGKNLTISCSHVAEKSSSYFSGPKRLKQDIIPEDDKSSVSKMELIFRNEEYDIAIFNSSNLPIEEHGKSRYDLSESKIITFEMAKKNISSAGYIYGIFGSMTQGYTYSDGISYMKIPFYTGLGSIVTVSNDEIIADFAEKELYELNTRSFPHLKGLCPTGGSRDISGASPSLQVMLKI